MEQGNRKERLAHALEAQFQECHGMFTTWMRVAHDRGSMADFEMEQTLRLVKTTAQLAAVIAKLEPAAPPGSQDSGSIPQ